MNFPAFLNFLFRICLVKLSLICFIQNNLFLIQNFLVIFLKMYIVYISFSKYRIFLIIDLVFVSWHLFVGSGSESGFDQKVRICNTGQDNILKAFFIFFFLLPFILLFYNNNQQNKSSSFRGVKFLRKTPCPFLDLRNRTCEKTEPRSILFNFYWKIYASTSKNYLNLPCYSTGICFHNFFPYCWMFLSGFILIIKRGCRVRNFTLYKISGFFCWLSSLTKHKRDNMLMRV